MGRWGGVGVFGVGSVEVLGGTEPYHNNDQKRRTLGDGVFDQHVSTKKDVRESKAADAPIEYREEKHTT